jgi:multiple antibiotic resistance protein
MAALRTAGGMLLLLMGIDLVFSRTTGASNATEEDVLEAEHKSDIAVFPLATPLIAGPGTMGAVILLMANVKDVFLHQVTVVSMLFLVLVITLLLLLGASTVN